jgi:rhodanese-related sulfurtransferase
MFDPLKSMREGMKPTSMAIPDAILVPIFEMESKLDALEEYKDKEIVTIRPGGGMSLVAVEVLNEAGFANVKSLKGGTDAWHKKGYPMVKD